MVHTNEMKIQGNWLFTSKPKAQELNTTGMYSVVRNPIYIGNFIIWAGIVLLARAALLAAVCVLAFFLYYERIIVAEAAAS